MPVSDIICPTSEDRITLQEIFKLDERRVLKILATFAVGELLCFLFTVIRLAKVGVLTVCSGGKTACEAEKQCTAANGALSFFIVFNLAVFGGTFFWIGYSMFVGGGYSAFVTRHRTSADDSSLLLIIHVITSTAVSSSIAVLHAAAAVIAAVTTSPKICSCTTASQQTAGTCSKPSGANPINIVLCVVCALNAGCLFTWSRILARAKAEHRAKLALASIDGLGAGAPRRPGTTSTTSSSSYTAVVAMDGRTNANLIVDHSRSSTAVLRDPSSSSHQQHKVTRQQRTFEL